MFSTSFLRSTGLVTERVRELSRLRIRYMSVYACLTRKRSCCVLHVDCGVLHIACYVVLGILLYVYYGGVLRKGTVC